jgi:imidazolonepropionase-like amidohydrolase
MFDGCADSTVPNAVIVVEGGTIKAAGSGLPVPAGARVIDLGDATLLPGFIDAHVHLTGESSDDCAGIDSVEHGSFLDDEALRLMKERGTYFMPTLMAGEYAGGRKSVRTYPPEIAAKARAAVEARSAAFRNAVRVGIKIAFGTDSAVSPHGRNAEEFALLVEHGLTPAAALRTATSGAATLLGIDKRAGTLTALA